jgi:hypothetical protein
MLSLTLLLLLAASSLAQPEDVALTEAAVSRHDAHVSGNEALARLGASLPAVAQRYGQEPEELARLLQIDDDLMVDGDNNLMFSCSGMSVKDDDDDDDDVDDDGVNDETGNRHHHHHHHHRKLAQVNADQPDPDVATLPLTASGVPILHSRISSLIKIYLDFDGHGEQPGRVQYIGILVTFAHAAHLPLLAMCSILTKSLQFIAVKASTSVRDQRHHICLRNT